MGKKLSSWNLFVQKIYKEGKAKNKSYEFRHALKDASSRKHEMSSSASANKSKKHRKSKKHSKKSKTMKRKH
jgi:hypothetical protein